MATLVYGEFAMELSFSTPRTSAPQGECSPCEGSERIKEVTWEGLKQERARTLGG